MSELFEHLDRLRNAEGKVALAPLVNTRGTTPRKEGAKMLVGEGGRILGSVTRNSAVPIRSRSPIYTSVSDKPSVVRFSPN